MNKHYISSVKSQFLAYKRLAEKTFSQLTDEQLRWQYNAESNSIATIVKHLSGNMRSRWTDFFTTDGEKEWRRRDDEFENDIPGREAMLQEWEAGWNCLFAVLDTLQPEDLGRTVYIRQEPHSVLEAINRQLAHYPYHVGQIVFLGKMLCNDNWQSLSIPRGKSDAYNQEKIALELRMKDHKKP